MHCTAGNDIPGALLSALSGHDTDSDNNPIVAFQADADLCTKHRHEALRELGKDKFAKAMHCKIKDGRIMATSPSFLNLMSLGDMHPKRIDVPGFDNKLDHLNQSVICGQAGQKGVGSKSRLVL